MKYLFVGLGLALVCLGAYSNSFQAGFAVDNHVIILEDPSIREATAGNVEQIFEHHYWWPKTDTNLYRPFTKLTYLFNYAVLGDGEAPVGYHVVNLILHALNAFFVFVLMRRLLQKFWPAVFVAALWAVHPVLTESVTNIVGRADLLAGLGILAGFWMYLRSTETEGARRITWLAGLAIVTAVGVFSKESALAVVGVIALYEITWWKERKQVRGLLLGAAACAVPIVLFLFMRSAALAGLLPQPIPFLDNPLAGQSFLVGRLTAVAVIAKYIWLLVWPAKLSCNYSFAQIRAIRGNWRDWLAWIVVAGMFFAALRQFRRRKELFFFAGFAFVTFVVVSNLIFPIGTIMAERLMYLPAVGFAACLVLGIYAIGERFGARKLAPVALCLIAAGLGVRTWYRNWDWMNELTLWTAAAQAAPNSAQVHKSLASSLYETDASHTSIDKVISESEKGIAILAPLPMQDLLHTVDYFETGGGYYLVRGDMKVRRGADGRHAPSDESLRDYRRGLEILERGAKIDEALDELHRKTAMASGKTDAEVAPFGNAELYRQLATAYLRLGRSEDAYAAAVHSRELKMDLAETHLLLAQVLMVMGRRDDAAAALIEGLFLTQNPRFFGPLQGLYRGGLDAKGCALTTGGDAPPMLNNSCEAVHAGICKAFANIISDYQWNRQGGSASETKARAMGQYSCSAELLEQKPKTTNVP